LNLFRISIFGFRVKKQREFQRNKATPIGAGKSSFELIDSTRLFIELNLKPGMTILDLACGKGAYSLVASERVGAGGSVYAVDLWEDGIAQLKLEITII
jgi:protein-L-isoaspartate O-methyltransferase